MKILTNLRVLALIALILCAVPTPSAVAQSDGWDWSVALYGWLPDLNLKGDDRGQSISRGDLLSKVELVLAGHFEGRRGKAGFLVDAMYLELADGTPLPDSPELGSGATLDVELEQLLLELGGFYRPSGGTTGFDVLFGARMIDMSDKLTIDGPIAPPIEPGQFPIVETSSNTLWDGFVGLRYSSRFTDRLGYSVRGDIATGGTDFTWNAVGSLSWNWGASRQHGLLLGWRYMDLELKADEDALVKNVVFTGPFIAARFGF